MNTSKSSFKYSLVKKCKSYTRNKRIFYTFITVSLLLGGIINVATHTAYYLKISSSEMKNNQ
jgi:hypothetical protein